ncbi:chemotaxis protein CheW [Teredinibacter turnerae]|uniref:CheW domain protein n=1 Tax=Teredinibacter turnerae (strain ATCC 39867 / T7901) TaxID=377629 RepID=C5BLL1_TERTT|nr:chemotaxis protein CheW [Teredinibacter turnerae]ACR11639.1 CheW domain protein [Teredinibacter turnerae T7901]
MSDSAFHVLANLAQRSRTSAAGLPARQDAAPRWSGIGFALLGQKFVAPMSHVSELMELPSATRLPGVQPWVIGLSNVRGRLLPLFDLALFFGGSMTSPKKHQRVLVLETDSLYSGIVVDRAFGMQHFTSDSYTQVDDGMPESIEGFVEGAYNDMHGEKWPVFSMARLAGDNRFTNAALV